VETLEKGKIERAAGQTGEGGKEIVELGALGIGQI